LPEIKQHIGEFGYRAIFISFRQLKLILSYQLGSNLKTLLTLGFHKILN